MRQINLCYIDNDRFYIGCESCGNWFHGSCVGVSMEAAKTMTSYLCAACSKKRSITSAAWQAPSGELYCVCRTPYDAQR